MPDTTEQPQDLPADVKTGVLSPDDEPGEDDAETSPEPPTEEPA